ncbi:MAG: tetratricopeptide repeat protein [Paracoccaceae bacterium]
MKKLLVFKYLVNVVLRVEKNPHNPTNRSQYNLGVIYQNGEGVPQDYKKAVRWWRLTAEHGDAESQHNLANRYYYGEGVAKDIVYAHMWKNLAFSNGFKPAKEHLKMFGQEMTSSQIETAQKLATECVKKNYKGC